MTYEEKRRWLSRYGDAMVKAKHLRDDLDEAERDTGCTTQQLTGMPGGSGDGQALPRAVERIEEARQAAEAQSAVCDAIRAELMDVFSQLDNEVDFMILFRRYVLLEDWDKIAVYVRLSRSQMFQHHSAAVRQLDIKSPEQTGADRT